MGTRMLTGTIPLDFSKLVMLAANESFGEGKGDMMERVSPITKNLLKFWFLDPFTNRNINFHEGQKQAILNAIYLHEVLGVKRPLDAYMQLGETLLRDNASLMTEMGKGKYAYPKYLVKMATGTGKTWVMHALLIWQYLNAKFEKGEKSGRWTKNFLVVAPGLIVYERLLDAFCGKRKDGSEERDFDTSDIKTFEELFVPPEYRNAVFAFLQNALIKKEEFGRKVTGDGVLAVMNWHAFLGDEKIKADDTEDEDVEGRKILDDILPAKPGVAAGNALDVLDAQFVRGGRLDFIKDLPDLMLINDEAHHIHGGGNEEVKWQAGIDLVAEGKGERFFQLDFSATPYESSGTGNRDGKNYFPHVISDYDLRTAIATGNVKTVMIDKRKDFTSQLMKLDYKAVRSGNKVVSLSDGQRLMLRAGLTRRQYLEDEFGKLDDKKSPKMMVVCEDTMVTPLVETFLADEGLKEEDILRIDSNKKGEISEDEWEKIKGKLFGIDKRKQPKVIISVLMLREGFDVNNICVIVPLRATKAPILLEQTMGRGLRLMWREAQYQEVKDIARRQVLEEKTEPNAVLDFLYIIEHPEFQAFYDVLIQEGLAGTSRESGDKGGGTGDLIKVKLKENYQQYDMFWPIIMRESEDVLTEALLDINDLRPFRDFEFEQLRRIFANEGETFIAQETTVKTMFGEYRVHANIFSARSYNEYIQGVIGAISRRMTRIDGRQTKRLPTFQINLANIAELIDRYIRTRLFGQTFDPFKNAEWKVLLCLEGLVTKHIIREVGELIFKKMANACETIPAVVKKYWFSSVDEIIVRVTHALTLRKTIYKMVGYRMHGGGLERDFMEFIDSDAGVERFIKIDEFRHVYARILYLGSDGLMREYIPDFLVATKDSIHLVETKANATLDTASVQSKRLAAIDWCKKVNALPADERMDREWVYNIITDAEFYAIRNGNGTFKDMCMATELTESAIKGEFLFD